MIDHVITDHIVDYLRTNRINYEVGRDANYNIKIDWANQTKDKLAYIIVMPNVTKVRTRRKPQVVLDHADPEYFDQLYELLKNL